MEAQELFDAVGSVKDFALRGKDQYEAIERLQEKQGKAFLWYCIFTSW